MRRAMNRQIVCEGFVLRPWRAGDEIPLVRHANNRKVWRNLRDRFPHPYTREDARAWISRIESEAGTPVDFAIVLHDEPIGGIGLELFDDVRKRVLEIGYWLGEAHWGKGIATEAVRRMTAYAFESFDVDRIEAGVFGWNRASCRVLEKAGYTFEGRQERAVFKDGEVTDRILYARLRDPALPSASP
jgi:RimJ/RimL family protein N-acetyltransferase